MELTFTIVSLIFGLVAVILAAIVIRGRKQMNIKDLIVGKRYRYTTKEGSIFEGTFSLVPTDLPYSKRTSLISVVQLTKKPKQWPLDCIIILKKSLRGLKAIE